MTDSSLRVLVGCEFSGAVREAFRRRGHDAWSCDILPAEDASPYHLLGDVRDQLDKGWDIGIFHPPCTRLCNSGSRWLVEPPGNPPREIDPAIHAAWPSMTREERLDAMWEQMRDGAALFSACLNAPIPHVAVENPVMHGHAKQAIAGYVEPTQKIHPWQFGHPDKKGTRLWLRNLRLLRYTRIVARKKRVNSIHETGPLNGERWKIRSRTFEGIAEAMADQWGRQIGGAAPL